MNNQVDVDSRLHRSAFFVNVGDRGNDAQRVRSVRGYDEGECEKAGQTFHASPNR